MRSSKNLSIGAVAMSLLVSAVVSGCASGPSVQEDQENKAAAVRSKTYMEGLAPVPASSKSVDVSCAAPSSKSGDWKDLVARAGRCVQDKNWKTLEQLANEIAKRDLDSPWGAYFLSVAAEGRGEYPRALWMIELAEKKTGGKSGLFLYQKGRVLIGMKDTTKGMGEIRKAVGLEPRLADGHLYLAEIYHRDQELDQAASHYNSVLTLEAGNYRALTGLAEVRLAQGNGTEAATLYSRAVTAHPSQLRPWIRLGWIYENVQKNGEQALSTYKGLKSSVDSGSIKERPEMDLAAKIKILEQTVARAPAQASAQKVEEKRSVK